MASSFKKVGSVLGSFVSGVGSLVSGLGPLLSGGEQQNSGQQSILNVAAPAAPAAQQLPVADDKLVQLKNKQRIQKLYGGRGRQGSILAPGGGDDTYG